MAAKGKNFSVYLNAELLEKLERIKAHLDYGTSQTIANLIDVRDNEIKDGVTRRQFMADLRGTLAGITEELARLRDRQDFFIDEGLKMLEERMIAIERKLGEEKDD
jgi:hypothetical protein